MKEIVIVENTSEIAAGTRGAALGVGALKVAARNKKSKFFSNYERFIIPDENDLLDIDPEFQYAKRIEGLINVYQSTSDIISYLINKDSFPLVLSGDHASAGGTIAGIKKAFPKKKLGVIWVDAHADLHTPYTTPSGNIHGMPLAVALNEDNLDCQINSPDEDAILAWNHLKQIGCDGPKIDPENLIFIAVRDTEEAEDRLIAKRDIKNYSVQEIRSKKLQIVIDEIKEKLNDCDLVYISFDVDSLDCEIVSKGTGTPVENGLTPEEVDYLMCSFASWEKSCCIEVVEINPCLDEKINKMAVTAFDIIEKFTEKLENRLK